MANNEARLDSGPPTPSPLLASPQSLLLPVHLVERKAMCTWCPWGCSLLSLGPPALPGPTSAPLCPLTLPSLCPLNLMAEFDASFLRCSGLGDCLPWPSSQPRLLFIVHWLFSSCPHMVVLPRAPPRSAPTHCSPFPGPSQPPRGLMSTRLGLFQPLLPHCASSLNSGVDETACQTLAPGIPLHARNRVLPLGLNSASSPLLLLPGHLWWVWSASS